MLRDLRLKAVYESEDDDLLRDFYVPALTVSQSYDRAVGFFSGAMLSYAAQGVSAFVKGGGHMRLIVGGELHEDDVRGIKEGYDLRYVSDRLGVEMVRALDAVDDELFQTRVELLSWLVASSRLDVKVALKKRGMFHSKIGIMTDANQDKVVFQGSANETAYALLPDFNFESMDVFPSWRPEVADYFVRHQSTFGRLWKNESTKAVVIEFPDAAKERLIEIAKRVRVAKPVEEIDIRDAVLARYELKPLTRSRPKLPATLGGRAFAMMDHQRDALQRWKAAGGTGILALATGAGKTVTAAYAATRMSEKKKRVCMIIAVPYVNLADQWVEVMRTFSVEAFSCYGGAAGWQDEVAEAAHYFTQGAWPFLCLVVVNRTLQGEEFQRLLATLPQDDVFWVGDECHRHAAAGVNSALPGGVKLRLGLSATPQHYLDEDANARLADWYGPVRATFDLKDALDAGVLTPYRYNVEMVDLTGQETDDYLDISDRIAAMAARAGGDLGEGNPQLDQLLFARARLLGGASNKLPALERLLGAEPTAHTLFYCSDATVTVDDEDGGLSTEQRQVEAVSQLLNRRGWRSSRFTAQENQFERRGILDAFRIGDVDALVAIRCLDEGIDVPACRRAFILASSRNPRQYVQRRGRILRRSPGKQFAEVHDFIVRLPDPGPGNEEVERRLLVQELARVAEFARLAQNVGEVRVKLLPFLERYDLAHHLV